jgi:hypothetical protein
MELERPKVDNDVLDFLKGAVLDPADFVIRTEEVCRLNPEMARMLVAKLSSPANMTGIGISLSRWPFQRLTFATSTKPPIIGCNFASCLRPHP